MRTHVSYIHASAAALIMTASIFMRESWYDAKIRSLHQGKLFYDLPLKIRVPDNHLLRFAFHPMKICKLVKNRVGSYPANAMSPNSVVWGLGRAWRHANTQRPVHMNRGRAGRSGDQYICTGCIAQGCVSL